MFWKCGCCQQNPLYHSLILFWHLHFLSIGHYPGPGNSWSQNGEFQMNYHQSMVTLKGACRLHKYICPYCIVLCFCLILATHMLTFFQFRTDWMIAPLCTISPHLPSLCHVLYCCVLGTEVKFIDSECLYHHGTMFLKEQWCHDQRCLCGNLNVCF